MTPEQVFITDQKTPFNIGQGKVKAYCYLSDWHKENLLNAFGQAGLAEYMMYPVTNGYSKEFYDIESHKKTISAILWNPLKHLKEKDYEYKYRSIVFRVLDGIKAACLVDADFLLSKDNKLAILYCLSEQCIDTVVFFEIF